MSNKIKLEDMIMMQFKRIENKEYFNNREKNFEYFPKDLKSNSILEKDESLLIKINTNKNCSYYLTNKKIFKTNGKTEEIIKYSQIDYCALALEGRKEESEKILAIVDNLENVTKLYGLEESLTPVFKSINWYKLNYKE